MTATTIDEVLAALDSVVERAIRDGDRVGYFAALYRTVTAKVKEGIESDFFDDAERMERLDVVFANRYLDALEAYQRGQRPTRAWLASFDACAQWRPIILQHLLVAINAHINLDLGVAAAQVAPGDELGGLRRDFDRINEILASMVGDVSRDVGQVSPWVAWLERVSSRQTDAIINFSLTVARREAWRFATELAPIPAEQLPGPIRTRDGHVAGLAEAVLHPGVLSTALLLVRARERRGVAQVIEVLGQMPAPALATVEARVRDPRAA